MNGMDAPANQTPPARLSPDKSATKSRGANFLRGGGGVLRWDFQREKSVSARPKGTTPRYGDKVHGCHRGTGHGGGTPGKGTGANTGIRGGVWTEKPWGGLESSHRGQRRAAVRQPCAWRPVADGPLTAECTGQVEKRGMGGMVDGGWNMVEGMGWSFPPPRVS